MVLLADLVSDGGTEELVGLLNDDDIFLFGQREGSGRMMTVAADGAARYAILGRGDPLAVVYLGRCEATD